MQKKQNNNKPKTKVSKKVVTYKAPVATTKVKTSTVPRIQNIRNDVRVCHREFITDIVGSVAFSSAQVFTINPGLVLTFPWLSSLATRFESYRFNRLKFLYETAAPTSTTGSVILTVDFDPNDLAPVSKTQALSYKSSVRSSPWQDCSFTADSEELRKRSTYFTRNNVVVSTDRQLYDVGNLFVCVAGQAGATAVGELYVEYDVTLMTPQLEALSGADRYIAGTAEMAPGVPFGTSWTYRGGLPVIVDPSFTSELLFESIGDYLMVWIVVGTGIADPAWTNGAGLTNTKISGLAAGGTNLTYVGRIHVTDTATSWTSPTTGAWTTVTTSKVYITPCVYTDFA